jgi:hypothetical protein
VAAAATQPVVLGLAFSKTAPVLHIGANMTVFMSVVVPTQTLDVTVTASTAASITLGSPALAGIFALTNVYVTDGTRTWVVATGGGSPTITFGDGNLLMVGAPFTGADYSTLVNSTFRAYLGTLVTGTSGSLYADLGTFDSIALADTGPPSVDAIPNDGVWTGLYNVRDLGFAVTNAKVFGQAVVSGELASNAPYQSIAGFDMDALRPAIDWHRISTGNPDYKGLLYLSSQSQGLPIANPANFRNTNDSARFDLTVNKRGVVVDITVGTTPPKQLPPVVVPSGAAILNAFKVWNGDDGAGNYAVDGIYPVTYAIRDIYGVQGVTVTSQIRLVSLRMQIKNAVMTPSSLVVNPNRPDDWTDPVQLTYRVELSNESNTSITSSMQVLGFPGNEWGGTPSLLARTVLAVGSQNLIAPDGTPFDVDGGGFDLWPDNDEDRQLLYNYRFDPNVTIANCFLGATDGNVVGPPGPVLIGDADTGNDYYSLYPGFQPPAPGPNPSLLTAFKGLTWLFRTDTSTSLRMSIIETLAGFDLIPVSSVPTTPNLLDPCSPGINPTFFGQSVHFQPDFNQGFIQARDTSLVFNINQQASPTLDTTAPLIVSTNPQDQTTFGPGSFGPSLPITVQVEDPESPIDPSGNTRIELHDPNGSLVGGSSSTSGGGVNNSSTIRFAPFANLNTGGQYTVKIYVCNTSALCLQKDIVFTVRDQTAPGVSSIELTSATQPGTQSLTLFQSSPDGPFDTITDVWATLSLPQSTANTIVWDLSTVSLEQVSGAARIAVPMTRISPVPGATPSDGRLRYRLNSPITTAGLYEVIVQTYSQDASGTQYTGPAGFVNPRFQTVVNNAVLAIRYPDNTLALTGTQPIYVSFTASSFTPSNTNPAARVPAYGDFVANSGFSPLVSAVSATGLQFVVGGVAQTQPATWAYPAANPLRATLYYNDSDLPTGVLASDLRVYGFNGNAWVPVSAATYVHTFTNVTANTFVIDIPNNNPAMAVYGIFHPSAAGNTGGQPTATPLAFKDTRSFNPTHRDPLYRRARIYYSEAPASSVEARIYDTSGQLVRTLSVGSGILLTDRLTEPSSGRSGYYFEWDGRNDSSILVRNGLYLIRWKVVGMDGVTEHRTRPVALIK